MILTALPLAEDAQPSKAMGAKHQGQEGTVSLQGFLIHPSLLDLHRAMEAAVSEADGFTAPSQPLPGGRDPAGMVRLPLWECVVIAGAIRTLKWRLKQLDMMPWRTRKAATGGAVGRAVLAHPLTAALIRALPEPPAALVARGALTGLNSKTLRMRLAQVGGVPLLNEWSASTLLNVC